MVIFPQIGTESYLRINKSSIELSLGNSALISARAHGPTSYTDDLVSVDYARRRERREATEARRRETRERYVSDFVHDCVDEQLIDAYDGGRGEPDRDG